MQRARAPGNQRATIPSRVAVFDQRAAEDPAAERPEAGELRRLTASAEERLRFLVPVWQWLPAAGFH
jgi:hypothetical protein